MPSKAYFSSLFYSLFTIACLLGLLPACKTPEAAGPQYTLGDTFLACTRFAAGTQWRFGRDGALAGDTTAQDTLQLLSRIIDSTQATAGTPGYYAFYYHMRILGDTTSDWRVLPFVSGLAGTVAPGKEEVLFFHNDSLLAGTTMNNLRYLGPKPIVVGGQAFDSALAFVRLRNGQDLRSDSNSTDSLWWAKGRGLIRFTLADSTAWSRQF